MTFHQKAVASTMNLLNLYNRDHQNLMCHHVDGNFSPLSVLCQVAWGGYAYLLEPHIAHNLTVATIL